MSKPSLKISSYLIPKIGEVLFAAAFIAVIGLGPLLLNMDGDLGRHITLGNYILDRGQIPTRDPFSFTKLGDPLTPHEWLSDVLFAIADRLAGLDGVVWMSALVIAISIWVVYRNSLEQSAMRLISVLAALLAAAASSLHWLARPHLFTILFSAIWVMELEKLRIGKRKNWYIFPLLMLIWVNMHGAFMAGMAIWACYFAGLILDRQASWTAQKPFLMAGIASILVTVVNPDGIGIWKTGLDFLGSRYLVSHTVEYLPPDFQDSSTWPFLILILASLFILASSRKRLALPHIFLLGGWTFMGLYSARNIPLYAVTTVPVLSAALADILEDSSELPLVAKIIAFQDRMKNAEKGLRGGLWALLVVVLALMLLLSGRKLDFQQRGNVFLEEIFPVEAVSWIEGHKQEGYGFNYFPWGGYLLYRMWPANLVFIDGQTDFYGEDLTREYEAVITISSEWQRILDKYSVQWIIMPVESRLAQELEHENNWERVYSDATAVIFAYQK